MSDDQPAPSPGPLSSSPDPRPASRLRTLARAGLLMTLVAIGCRFASLEKELFVAATFGAGTVVDAFSLAMLVPWAGMAVYANGLRRAFQTQFGSHERHGAEAAEQFGNRYVAVAMTASFVAAGLAYLGLPSLWSLLSAGREDVAAALAGLTLPTAVALIPMTAAVTLTAMLNVRGRFAGPQLAVLFVPAVVVTSLLVVPSPNAVTLMWATGAGFAVQSLVLGGLLLALGHRFAWRGDAETSGVVRTLWVVGLSTIALDVMDFVNTLVDRAMAASLPAGNVAILHWSALLKDAFTGTLVMSMLTVLTPEFGRQVAEGNRDGLRRTCTRLLVGAAVCVLPLSALVVVCGPPVFATLRIGELDRAASGAIGLCLAGYAFALPGTLVGPLYLQVLVAHRRLWTVAAIGLCASFLPNLLLNLVLIGPFGAAGLAMSTSIAATLGLIAAYLVVRRTVGIEDERRTLAVVVGAVGTAGVATCIGWWSVSSLDPSGAGFVPAAVGGVVVGIVSLIGLWVTPAGAALVETLRSLRGTSVGVGEDKGGP